MYDMHASFLSVTRVNYRERERERLHSKGFACNRRRFKFLYKQQSKWHKIPMKYIDLELVHKRRRGEYFVNSTGIDDMYLISKRVKTTKILQSKKRGLK